MWSIHQLSRWLISIKEHDWSLWVRFFLLIIFVHSQNSNFKILFKESQLSSIRTNNLVNSYTIWKNIKKRVILLFFHPRGGYDIWWIPSSLMPSNSWFIEVWRRMDLLTVVCGGLREMCFVDGILFLWTGQHHYTITSSWNKLVQVFIQQLQGLPLHNSGDVNLRWVVIRHRIQAGGT